MGNLADVIERYIRALMESAQQETLELQRHELARRFECVPSQINYVLSTRFTLERGYMVESRRGGGGYIRIVRAAISPHATLLQRLSELVGDSLTAREADDLLHRLHDDRLLDDDDVVRIKIILLRELAGTPDEWRNLLRARMVRALLAIVLGGGGR